ncbi:hypothetical protein F2981_03425 [Sinorhizobium meliloti]|nr:hypothetical protein [Sinorhizobium meliloti]
MGGCEIAVRHHLHWKPDIVHVHDWQSAHPVYMRFGRRPGSADGDDDHNIAFQGQFGASVFPELALPPDASPRIPPILWRCRLLKAGPADGKRNPRRSALSYAQEILKPEFRHGS